VFPNFRRRIRIDVIGEEHARTNDGMVLFTPREIGRVGQAEGSFSRTDRLSVQNASPSLVDQLAVAIDIHEEKPVSPLRLIVEYFPPTAPRRN
jgi:hypothetical protein